MTMSREWAHAKLIGQRHGLLVSGCGCLGIRGLALCGNLTEEPQRIGLVPALLEIPRALEGVPGLLARVLDAAGQQIRFAEMRHEERIVDHLFCRCAMLYGLLEQRQRLREAPGQRIGISQERGNPGEEELDVPGLTDAQAPFEPGDSLGEVPFAEAEQTDAKIRMTQGEG